MLASDLIKLTARDVVAKLKQGEVSPLDLLDALEARIAEVEPKVNALPTLCLDRARDHAKQLQDKPASERGLLAGLPVGIKDLDDVGGVRTTYGSLIFEDHVPDRSDILVETLEGNGGVIYAKTNTPEFGAGANTFNEVFGATLNPWDITKSCAGSSGGSAVALATGAAWMASGSDMGGSLRNPASFCSIVGLRPSPGRVARGPKDLPFNILGAHGPMARNVPDLAFMLDAMVGEHPEDPISLAKPAQSFTDAVNARKLPKRVAFSVDLGGITPVDPEVAKVVTAAVKRFEEMGVVVEEACPDFSEVQKIFQTLRAVSFASSMKEWLRDMPEKLKPEVIWNVEKGLALSMDEIAEAELARGRLYKDVAKFFQTYDLLLSPATIVAPYPVEHRFVASCNGVEFSNYVEWLTIAYAITCATCPALSVPAGFTEAGLPVGLQIVGPPKGEAPLLSAAALYEETTGFADLVPIDPRG